MRLIAIGLVLAAAGVASAQQDNLTPTDILAPGNVSVDGRFAITQGSVALTDNGVPDFDLETDTLQFILSAGVGLGMGFEAEAMIPYQFIGKTDGDWNLGALDVDTEQDTDGFGDLELRGNYRILEENATSPQLIAGIILIAPSGDDDEGQPEVTTTPPSMFEQEGKDGGIGKGVWSYGLGAAISKRTGPLEPYFGVQYVIGGERKENGVDEDRADKLSLLAGAEFHATETTRFDLRLLYELVGKDVTEDAGAEKEEDKHFQYGAQASAYFTAAPTVNIILGVGGFWAEDHKPDTTSTEEISDAFFWQAQVGVHILVGP